MTKSIVDLKSASGGIIVDLVEKDKIHVLHVDDDPVFLNTAKQCLEARGKFHVDTALSVEEAQEKMSGKTYDVIICESVMPGKQGLEFLKELRDSGSDIAFIIFTGKGTEDLATKALNLGANRYFSKVGCLETACDELIQGICQVVESKKAKEALRQSENYLKTMLDSVFTGLVVIDEETHRIVDANKHALEAIGASRGDVVGKVCHRFICPAENGKCPITDLGQTVDRSERVLLTADGGKVPILKTVTRMTYKNHKYLVDSFVDITDLKKAEHAMLENQEKFRQLFIDNPEPAVYVDPDSRILNVNPRFTELFGYSLNEIKGKHINEVVVPDDKMEEAEMLDAKSFKGYVYHETVRRRKNGSLIPVSVSIAPITLEGRITGSVALYRDITERIRYERSLSGLNAYSRKLNMAKNLEEIYELTLDAAEKILGFEFVNVRILEAEKLRLVAHRGSSGVLSPELPLHADKSIIARSARTGKTILVPDVRKEEAYVEGGFGAQSELAVPMKTRERVLGVLNVESVKLGAFNDKDSELLEILASHAATAMSNLEYAKSLEMQAREIRETQEKFERLFLNSPEAAAYMDPSFHILDINPRFTELFEYTLDEVKGRHIDDVVVPKDKMEEAKMLGDKFMKGPVYFDTVRQRKDGSRVPVSISGSPIIVEGRLTGTIGLYKDISQLKKTEKVIRESQQMFERLFTDNPEAAVHLDSSFHILNVNPRFMRLFGYSLDEIKGKHINNAIVPKEKMEEAVVFDERASKGEMYHEDTVRKRKDGSLVPVAFSAAPIIVENQVIGHIAVYKDISQLKKAEEELRETLKKLEKTNEKLRVVGGLTRHDVRNKLSAITGNVYLAKKNLADNQVLKNLKEMESAVAQMVRIFDFAKTYEMLGVEELRFVDVEKMVNEAISLFSDLKGVKVVNNCHGLMILADSLLRQLFYNFVDNSLKYGEKSKTITIHYEETDKDQLKLVYEDDGIGLAESEKKKLFQEGYGRGTGYGLYLIRKICEGYGWNIQETGKEGEGAQFTITIPRIDEKGKTNYTVS